MVGVIVNCLAVLLGGGIGLVFKKGIPPKIANTVMSGLALCVLYIGISGTMSGKKTLVAILSIVIGAIIGELLDLDLRINQLGGWLENKFQSKSGEKTSISQGFVTSSLLFCVGAMAIVGSLQSGLTGSNQTLFAKSLLDGVSAIIFASSLGAGVLLSGILILVYQGSIALLAQFISPYLTTPVINEITCVGSLLIIALSLNMLKLTKIKVMNLVPAVFLPIVLCRFM
jgi:uncharacterized membrane protein YqgA involved in biofilm formation